MKPAIAVLGSLNMDFVVSVAHLPAPGETVLGCDFQTIPGGKGANQACAAGRLASDTVAVRMAGRVGEDVFGDQLKASLAAAHVDVSFVHAMRSQPTGVALIWVDAGGQNSIVVASGANYALAAGDVESLRPFYRGAAAALFQLETPLDAVAAALRLAKEEGAMSILDPAPAQALPSALLAHVDVLTPNETEAAILLGRPASGRLSLADAPAVAQSLRQLGPSRIVLKLGDRGCYFWDGGEGMHVPSFPVTAVDSTAAGDTFNGALAVALGEGVALPQALRFANAAAALSVTRRGAQASVPTRAEVDGFLRA
ncbi:MAG TPA: ribokinase [Solibacterales bacterium]|nr:ribokinase [Bryobacterales bacterium]